MKHLYQDPSGIIHTCKGERAIDYDRDTYLVWTDCLKDVPANKSFRGTDKVTCKKCLNLTGGKDEQRNNQKQTT